MRRVLFEVPFHYIGLPDLPLYAYGFLLMLGFLAGVGLAKRLARREGLPTTVVYDIAVIAVVAGIVGARLMWVFRFAPPGLELVDTLAVWQGGLVFYGGLLGALVCCTYYVWRRGLPVARVADSFAPAAMLGLAFGRVGCFLNGCCYGAVCGTADWICVRFPPGSSASLHHFGEPAGRHMESLPVYPAQLFASGSALLICGVLLLLYAHRRFPGQVTLAMLMLYALGRFLLEFVRDDTPLQPYLPGLPLLREGQMMALVTFVIAGILMAVFWYRAGNGKKAPASEDDTTGASETTTDEQVKVEGTGE